MSQHVLYAYVDGSDLDLLAPALEARFAAFVSGKRWLVRDVWVVNQRHGPETCTQPGDLPDWDLGLNLQLPKPDAEPPGWFADVEAVVQFLGELHGEFGREFVLGIADVETGIADDMFFVSTAAPNVEELRQWLGVGDMR